MSYTHPNKNALIGKLTAANMNTTADQLITMNSARYVIKNIVIASASTSLTTAVGGFYTATSKGGTAIVTAAQVYSGLTGATKYIEVALGSLISTDVLTAASLYFSLTIAQGSAATANIYIFGLILD